MTARTSTPRPARDDVRNFCRWCGAEFALMDSVEREHHWCGPTSTPEHTICCHDCGVPLPADEDCPNDHPAE